MYSLDVFSYNYSCSLTGSVYQSPSLLKSILHTVYFHMSHGHCKANIIIIIIIKATSLQKMVR